MEILDGFVVRFILTALAALVVSFFVNLYRVRSHVRSLQKQGLVCWNLKLSRIPATDYH
jgi:hypothetical protein